MTDLEIVSAEVRARDHDRYLSVLYSAPVARPALFALHGLDLEMAAIVAGTTEPMIGEIRLAWWREALVGLDTGKVPAQPLLSVIANQVLAMGLSGAELAGLDDRWLGLIGSDMVPAAHIEGGGALFALAARVMGGDPVLAARLGQVWASGEVATLPAIPGVLRPLLGLVRLAWRDADRVRSGQPREVRGSIGRQLRMLGSVALGR